MKHSDLIELRGGYQENLDDLDMFAKMILSIQIRIKKIDLILDPKYNLTTFVDKKTGHRYLQAKVYWPNNEGKITRSLSFSLGNMINYPDIESQSDEIKKEIQEILMKKFGELI